MKFSYGATPRGHYTPAVISRGMVYISGQTSLDGSTGLPAAGGVEAEAMFALKKLDPILEAAGYSLSDVVKTTVLLDDMANFAAVNAVYAEFFPENCPARACFAAKALPKGALVEIEAIAAK